MAARKTFTDKELQSMVDKLALPKATKTAVAKEFGIAPSTLTKRIDEFQDRQVKAEARKEAKKHTRLSADEKAEIVDYYINDQWSMNKIAQFVQRSAGAVKRALEDANIPIRKRGKAAVTTAPIVGDTESALKEGSRVFSFKYNAYAIVQSLWGIDGDIFRIWVDSESHQFSAYQSRENLALIP